MKQKINTVLNKTRRKWAISYRKNLKFGTSAGYNLALLINHRFFTKRWSIIFFLYKLMRVESRVFPPSIAKRVEGIFGYDILLYGFLFRRQWGSFSRSFARIGVLFIKWRQVEHKAARTRTFLVRLARSIPCAAVYKLRFTLEKQEKIYVCFALISIYKPNFLVFNFFGKNKHCRKKFTGSILCSFGSSTATFFFWRIFHILIFR